VLRRNKLWLTVPDEDVRVLGSAPSDDEESAAGNGGQSTVDDNEAPSEAQG
jgi:hypothetical protein